MDAFGDRFRHVDSDIQGQVWPSLLSLARNRQVRSNTRERAVFWLGQQVADEATDGLAEIIDSDEEDIEIRRQAIFALSQQENERAIPLLIDIARSPLHPELRRQAFFWLADSEDERAIDFFEEILTGS